MPHASTLFNFLYFLPKLFSSTFSLGPLDHLMPHDITLNKLFVIFIEIVIFVSFVDHLQLFIIFVNLVIACNPEHISKRKTDGLIFFLPLYDSSKNSIVS